MTTALLLIATRPLYHEFAREIIKSADTYFVPHETVLFTDSDSDFGVNRIKCPTFGFPDATLKRYHLFLEHENLLRGFDYLFYVDVDALFVDSVGQEIFGPDITAVPHKGFNQHTWDFHLEENPQSAAHMTYAPPMSYYVGGFNGGASEAFLEMARNIRAAVDTDAANGIRAKWNDESYLNKYLSVQKPSTVLSIDYGFPEPEVPGYAGSPKLIFLEKSWRAQPQEYR